MSFDEIFNLTSGGFFYSRSIMENRPVDPDNIEESHRPICFMRIKYKTRANDLP